MIKTVHLSAIPVLVGPDSCCRIRSRVGGFQEVTIAHKGAYL
jgi:hypothetical protein